MSLRTPHERGNERPDGGREALLRESSYHHRQEALDAVFYDNAGWAGVFWYGANEELAADYDIPDGIADSKAIGVEHLATRENVGVYDLTPLTPVEIRGPGAGEYVQRLFSNDMNVGIGGTRYAVMCNEEGGVLGDLVVARLNDDRYLAVAVAGQAGDDQAAWMQEHAPDDVTVVNRDSAYTGIGFWGPKARSVAQSLTDQDLSHETFPYFTTQQFRLGGVPVIAMRLSFVGELGWELWTPTEYGDALWEALWEAGRDHGIVAMGDGAITTLSGEKGYRMWGWDLDASHNPYESKLGHTVDLNTDFIGKDALQQIQDHGLERRMACMTLDDSSVVTAAEDDVLAGGEVVGQVIRSEYGYTVEESIAFAYLPVEYTDPDTSLEIESEGDRYAATVQEEPLFDKENERMLQ